MIKSKNWDWEITPKTSYWGWSTKELWSYRHLLTGLMRRHFLLSYQQTVIGPFWMLFNPIVTLATYILVFHKLIGISTGSIPPVLFYASGVLLWNFFNGCFTGTSATFRENSEVFKKVYFPRIIMPISVISTQFTRFFMQLLMFFLVIGYYNIFQGLVVPVNLWLLSIPVTILTISAFGLGLGLFFSVLTAKYRDMSNVVSLSVRLLMFVTPVIYPMSTIPVKWHWIVQLNPLTPQFELFRLSLLGQGTVTPGQIFYSCLSIMIVLAGGLLLFNKQGDKLIDVV